MNAYEKELSVAGHSLDLDQFLLRITKIGLNNWLIRTVDYIL